MKGVALAVALLATMALNLSARNFTLRGRFTDVANDTLRIEYVVREPEKGW